MMGFDIAIFTFPLVKMAAFLVWLALAALTGFRLWKVAVTKNRLSKLWLAVAVVLAILAWIFATSQRHMPKVKLDTGGVRVEQVLPKPVITSPIIDQEQQRAFDEAIRQREQELRDFQRLNEQGSR